MSYKHSIWHKVMLGLFLSALMSLAWSGIEVRNFDNKEQEVLYKQLMNELRCLVCQNENLAESHAELAKDLRDQVYEMITVENLGEIEVKTFLVERYGDFVLYKPPINKSTWLLWFGPFIMLAAGFIVLISVTRRNKSEKTVTLDKSKRDEVRKLLESED